MSLESFQAVAPISELTLPSLAASRPGFTLEDALNAPLSLMLEQSQPIYSRSQSGRGKSFVKKALPGHVPDRGGRVNEIRGSNKKLLFGLGRRGDNRGRGDRGQISENPASGSAKQEDKPGAGSHGKHFYKRQKR